FAEQVEIEIAEDTPVAIRIVDLVDIAAAIGDAQPVIEQARNRRLTETRPRLEQTGRIGLRHGHELAARGQTNVDSRRGRMERADHDAAARFVDVRPEERKGIAVAARNQRCTRRALRTWLTHGHTD